MPTSCFNALREREQAVPRDLSAGAAAFRSQMSGSQSLICRMELQRNLEGHGGCVNTVSFNPTGDLLVSGSDDQSVMLWDWRRGLRRLRFEPGHTNNIFQARFLPGSHDKTLVSCAADGQVRVSFFREGSSRPFTKRLHRHMGRAHKLALQHASPYDPSYGGGGGGGPPCFYSSGEDGDVCLFDLRVCDSEPLGRMAASASGKWATGGDGRTGSQQNRQIIDLNAIHVNPARPWQLVVGGADEAVVVYDNRSLTSLTSSYGVDSTRDGGTAAAAQTRCRRVVGRPVLELCPLSLRRGVDPGAVRRRPTHVTCVMFGQNGDVLTTYNDDDVYLFRPPGTQGSGGGQGKPGSTGDSDSEEERRGARGRRTKTTTTTTATGTSGSGGSGSRRGTKDAEDEEDNDDEFDSFLRPSRRRRRGGGGAAASAPTASSPAALGVGDSGSGGDAVLPDDYVVGRYSGHRNRQTVKGVNFLGEREEWVVSGSDCGHIYIWSRDSCRLQCWLRGDTHVVNCLEPHPCLPLHLATSGIDDDIKLWAPTAESPHPPGPSAHVTMEDNARQRSADHSRVLGGGRRVVIPRAMLRMLLGDLARGGDDDGEARGGGGGGDDGGGSDGSAAARHRHLRDLLMAALRAGDDDDDDNDEEVDEEEGDEEEEDEEGEDNEGGIEWVREEEESDEDNEGEEMDVRTDVPSPST